MPKLVYGSDLGSDVVRHEGSTPSRSTKKKKHYE